MPTRPAQTGVEMEALTAVSVAALTIYDMCKAVDAAMVIEGIRVTEKSGRSRARDLRRTAEPPRLPRIVTGPEIELRPLANR